MIVDGGEISFGEDGVTVDAALAARKLGLSDDDFRASLRQGIVYSLVERGQGEDEGRIRLTLRCRSRSWSVIVETKGAASGSQDRVSDPAPPTGG